MNIFPEQLFLKFLEVIFTHAKKLMFKIKDVGGKPKNGLGFFCHINFNKKVYSFIVMNGQGP